jgi:biotin operon repressor
MEKLAQTKTAPLTPFAVAQQKIKYLLSLEVISLEDLADLTEMERSYLGQIATKKLDMLDGAERGKFLEKITAILDPGTKNKLWENNQMVISHAISNYIQQYGAMPPATAIAEETGLSRQTVTKHFKEYKTHPGFLSEMEQFKFLTPKLLANVYKYAENGNMKAAKLYFETIGAINKRQANTVVNSQNNYIQINNTILSQENLSQLSAEQLDQIERMITNIGQKS